MNFKISTGNSRKDKFWKQEKYTWDEFIQKLSHTIVTSETQAEYLKMGKTQRDDLKDIGGFIAGELKDGRRLRENVINRTMITLDMDYADDAEVIAEKIEKLYDCACCIYSTRRHTKEKPRLRIIIPTLRPVTADEYQAISRMIAKQIGIEMFDDTTYEPNRLMYWPSTSCDGEYFYRNIDGSFLNPDSILSLYEDWKDTSKWPVSSRQTSIIKRTMKEQEDPLIKKGVIGAFCRSYTITEVIDLFLKDIYKPSMTEKRYEYIQADSSAGVLIYDNKYAYSHHATDPACNKLLNAFDLVRIHKFGELDEGIDDKTSFNKMLEFCNKDEKVKKQMAPEQERDEQQEVTSDENWKLSLKKNRNGTVKDTPTNILNIMRNDTKLKAIAYNKMTNSIDVNGIIPWKQVKPGWNDTDLANLKMYLDSQYGIWAPVKVKDALLAAASERAFHPIKDYLDGLPDWDETERLDTLLIDYLGAEDNRYTRAVMRKTLVAAVTRVYEPGIKFDYILVLNGPQGVGKSTFFAKLGGKWFSDSLTVSDMRDKSGAEKLQGYWILELGELAGLRKMDVETVKSFITRTDDKFRQSYGINVENHPRQCIIVGSTNSTSGFLRDVTGNRRFWPVKVNGGTKSVWDLDEIDQIWAEAIYKYRAGEALILTGDEERMACEEQKDAMETDDREGIVEQYLERMLPDNWKDMNINERRTYLAGESEYGQTIPEGAIRRERVCPLEIWCECFGKDRSDIKKKDSYEIEAILMSIGGWKRYDGNKRGNLKFPIYNSQRAFIRVAD